MIDRKALTTYLKSPALSEPLKRQIRRILENNKVVLPGWSPTFLSRLGKIDVIVDVGVLNGTPGLYKAFPDAHLILVEALPCYEKKCRQLIANRSGGGEAYMYAVGSEEGTAHIRHYHDLPARSSLLENSSDNSLQYTEIEVPLRRLDRLLSKDQLKGKVVLKIDVEGMELDVLRGATGILPEIKYIIAEARIKQRHQNSYRFADLVGFLAEHGFNLYDALRITRARAMHPEASIIDAIFINLR
jgi:FkbM family methyltransferase